MLTVTCVCTQEELTETDRLLRQQQQEVDSLTFRNSQLTRRVAVLQEELEPSPQVAALSGVVPDTHRIQQTQQTVYLVK